MSGVNLIKGGVISVNPLVTYSGGGDPDRLGIAATFPEYFRGRKALHFIALEWTVEHVGADAIFDKIARLQAELPDSLFVFVAGDDYENFLLSRAGLITIQASQLALIDERFYRPLPPKEGVPSFDAVYNARLDRWKRHELAAHIKSLMLVYFELHDGTDQLTLVKASLPHAFFANKELTGQDLGWLDAKIVPELLANAQVGLCLSAQEGVMRASMEYQLCGLTVVSTESSGGRGRYLTPPFSKIVAATPDAVAAGVAELVARNIPKASVRNHIGQILSFERYNFLLTANRIAKLHLGVHRAFPSLLPFMRFSNIHRPAAEAIEPLAQRPADAPNSSQ